MTKTLLMKDSLVYKVIRADQILTTSYVESQTFNIMGASQVQLLMKFVKGSSNGLNYIIEFSIDQIEFYQECILLPLQITPFVVCEPMTREITGEYNLVINVPVSTSYIRVKVKALESTVGTSLKITATATNI